MRMPAIKKIRIPVMAMLLCCEVGLIFYLRGQPSFRVSLTNSLLLVLLVLPLLWIREIWRRNISYFVFVFVALAASLSIGELLAGQRLDLPLINLSVFALFIFGSTMRRHSRSNERSEEQYQVRKAEDIRFFLVCINVAGMVSCFVFLAFHPDTSYSNSTLFIAFLFLCGTVYCLFIKQTQAGPSLDPGQDWLGSGGRHDYPRQLHDGGENKGGLA